jgi:hypothetical protein
VVYLITDAIFLKELYIITIIIVVGSTALGGPWPPLRGLWITPNDAQHSVELHWANQLVVETST